MSEHTTHCLCRDDSCRDDLADWIAEQNRNMQVALRAERDRARDLVAFLESETDPGNAETVERAAQVIWSHDWNNNLAGSWEEQPDGWRAPYRVIARAVLTSLRHPAELDPAPAAAPPQELKET